jgi:hypothetical protein
VVAVFIACLRAGSANAWVLDEQAMVNIGGESKYAGNTELITIPLFDISPSIPLGAIGCFGVCLGLEAEAGGHADIDARFAVGYGSSINLASTANARTLVFGQGLKPSVGDPFFLVNGIDPLGIKKLDVKSADVGAFAGLDVDLGGFARAKACVIGCVEGKISLKVDTIISLASVDGQGLKVFGSLVDTSPPYSANAPAPFGSFVSASANVPTLATTFSNLAPGTPALMQDRQEPMLTLKADVAGLVAKAAGFPIPLKGSLLGFGYNLLSLDTYAGVDLKHDFALSVLGLKTVYQFSSPVQVFDEISQTWGDPVTEVILGDSEWVRLRNPSALSLGFTRSYRLDYDVDYDYDLVLNAGLDLSALGISGHGLKLGPLLDPDPWNINLGSVDVDSGTKAGAFVSTGSTSSIAFDGLKLSLPGDEQPPVVIDICAAIGGCQESGYVTVRDDVGDGIFQETTYRVTNFGVAGCGPDGLLGCAIDPDFSPEVRYVRATQLQRGEGVTFSPDLLGDGALLAALQEAGIDLFGASPPPILAEYAPDFTQLDAFLNAPALEPGQQSSNAMLLASLRALGVDLDNPFPRTPIDPGVPYGTSIDANDSFSATLSVPEPSTFALLVIGAMMLWLTRRRRRERQVLLIPSSRHL